MCFYILFIKPSFVVPLNHVSSMPRTDGRYWCSCQLWLQGQGECRPPAPHRHMFKLLIQVTNISGRKLSLYMWVKAGDINSWIYKNVPKYRLNIPKVDIDRLINNIVITERDTFTVSIHTHK